MKFEKFNELLDKYYDGNTSIQEEKMITKYLLDHPQKENLAIERDIFLAFYSEQRPVKQTKTRPLYLKYIKPIIGVAATFLILISFNKYQQNQIQKRQFEYEQVMYAFEILAYSKQKVKEGLNEILNQKEKINSYFLINKPFESTKRRSNVILFNANRKRYF